MYKSIYVPWKPVEETENIKYANYLDRVEQR